MSKVFGISEVSSAYDLEDRLCDFALNKRERREPSGELRAHPNTATIIDNLLSPIRREDPLKLDTVKWRWGTMTIVRDDSMPEGTVLLT